MKTLKDVWVAIHIFYLDIPLLCPITIAMKAYSGSMSSHQCYESV